MIVADTNLIAYLVLAGARTEAAEGVRRRDPVWTSPPLWLSEFHNVLVLTCRHQGLSRHGADLALADALGIVRPRTVPSSAVLDLALHHGLSGYDAEFVALAEALGVPLVTDDRRVLAACPGVAVSVDGFAAG